MNDKIDTMINDYFLRINNKSSQTFNWFKYLLMFARFWDSHAVASPGDSVVVAAAVALPAVPVAAPGPPIDGAANGNGPRGRKRGYVHTEETVTKMKLGQQRRLAAKRTDEVSKLGALAGGDVAGVFEN